MASWTESTPSSTPQVKFENSPAESFMSTPGADMYSLFSTPAPSTMNPMETVMTPQSIDENDFEVDIKDEADSPGADGEKKTKKRKSWGQVLPEPKTNLPPRKRAKTEDEKEQRRVERVLRNRRAAQSSRERKRQEVEALEKRNQELEALLDQHKKQTMMLMEELNKMRRSSGVVATTSSPLLDSLDGPVTLSQPLFGASELADGKPTMMNDFILMPDNEGTVNPASISPELAPVPDEALPQPALVASAHRGVVRPAVSVSRSARVVSDSAEAAPSAGSLPTVPNAFDGLFGDALSLSATNPADSWSSQAQFSPSSDPFNFEYNHLDGDASAELPEFDFAQFLDDDLSGAAPGATAGHVSVLHEPEPSFGLFDSETQVSSENLNQQSLAGASSKGCDAGIIAVGI
ncbi:putative BZIP domain-containing protein [Seiridium unicorne]|uniref:BZIP domain-containing protein n=1 Tax=Seiridium unicorne TaxID=138068 RepID=A0ABR2VFH6_9PEZI